MKNLTLNLDEEILLLAKYNLNPNELRFIQLLLMLQNEDYEVSLFRDYLKILKDSGINLRELIANLQNKEIILKSYTLGNAGDKFDPNEIPFNKNFVKNLYKSSFALGKELFEVYPQFAIINNTYVPIRSVARHYDSLELAYFKYGKAIGFDPEKHEEIIELVQWAGENQLINCSLSSFIINNGWLDLQAMREGKTMNINYDTMREL